MRSRTSMRTAFFLMVMVLLMLASACARDAGDSEDSLSGTQSQGDAGPNRVGAEIDTGGSEPQSFDVAMEGKFVYSARDLLGRSWGEVSDRQLLEVGTAYCEFRAAERNTTAAANAVALLALQGVDIGYDATGLLDDRSRDLAATVIVAAEDSICTRFNRAVTSSSAPGTSELLRFGPIAEYIPATGVASPDLVPGLPRTPRSRVEASAEVLYLTTLESMSMSLGAPVRISAAAEEDQWLAVGYFYCVAADQAGIGYGHSALTISLGVPSEQAIFVAFASASYLCPEYLEQLVETLD